MGETEWWDLRSILLDAASGQLSPLVNQYSDHPIAVAASEYVKDRRHERQLNEAAKQLAAMKIGVDPKVIEKNYWLVLEKS